MQKERCAQLLTWNTTPGDSGKVSGRAQTDRGLQTTTPKRSHERQQTVRERQAAACSGHVRKTPCLRTPGECFCLVDGSCDYVGDTQTGEGETLSGNTPAF